MKDLRIKSASEKLENFRFPSESDSKNSLDDIDSQEEPESKDKELQKAIYVNKINEVANSILSVKEMKQNGEFQMREGFLDFDSGDEDILKIRHVKNPQTNQKSKKGKKYKTVANRNSSKPRCSLAPKPSKEPELWAFKSNKEFAKSDEFYGDFQPSEIITKPVGDMDIKVRQTGEIEVNEERYSSKRKRTMYWDNNFPDPFSLKNDYKRFDSSEVDLLPGLKKNEAFKKTKSKEGDSGQSLDFLN